MRFAHIADCHLGAWGSHPELREMPLHAFDIAVGRILEANVDFVLLAGDFFDSSMPAVDILRFTVEQLMRLKNADIPVYAIAGSHDYSPTGKTMLSVLEAADLLKNVHMKWIEDKSGARIFGVEGLRGGLDRENFGEINARGDGYKILMFHAAVDEISGMKGVSCSALPKGFDYYATGHVHNPTQRALGEGLMVFPGPLFPTEFSELEELKCGRFCIADVRGGKTRVSEERIEFAPVRVIDIKCEGKTPQEIENEFANEISDVTGAIVLLKASGTIVGGKPADVNWRAITERSQAAGACAVKRSVHLSTKEAETITVDITGNLEQIEKAIIEKHSGSDFEQVRRLMDVLAVEKVEDEKNITYEERIKSGIKKVMKLDV
jgi:hypothetical protein